MKHRRWNEPVTTKFPSKITIPEHAHPVARFIFEQMCAQRVTYSELEACSGVLRCTIKAWRHENTPGINSADACLGVVGYTLVPVPLPETLAPALRADLEELAVKHNLRRDLRTDLIAACVGREPYTAKAWAEKRKVEAA